MPRCVGVATPKRRSGVGFSGDRLDLAQRDESVESGCDRAATGAHGRERRPPGLHACRGVLERAGRDDAGVGRFSRSASTWTFSGSSIRPIPTRAATLLIEIQQQFKTGMVLAGVELRRQRILSI